jgi:glycerol-3-phosphate dehydrogenase
MASTMADLGEHFGAGLTAAELGYLVESEWAVTAEDILWRRTKLGLHMTEAQRTSVDRHLDARGIAAHSAAIART